MSAYSARPAQPGRRFLAAAFAAAAVMAMVLFVALPGKAADVHDACTAERLGVIEVTVENVRSSNGLITAVLYADNPETLGEKPRRQTSHSLCRGRP